MVAFSFTRAWLVVKLLACAEQGVVINCVVGELAGL